MEFTDEYILGLLNSKQETINQDYKQDLIWNKENRDSLLGIVKDILAMANTKDGGKLIFGVRDRDFEFLGLSEVSWNSFDVTDVNQLLHNFADPVFTCNVLKRIIDNKKVVIIDIPEFIETPIICKNSAFSSKNTQILQKGAIYIRTAKCTSEMITSVEDMRNILGRSLANKSDELLLSIQKLISGKPILPNESSQNAYVNEIKDGVLFLKNIIKEDFGYWQLVIYPSSYVNNRISSHLEAGKLIEESKVIVRGWDFPHIDTHGNTTNFNEGRQSYVKWERFFEAWRLYFSGLFVWRKYFWEDIENHKEKNSRSVLSFISAIYSITEFMLFCKRIYGEKFSVDSIHLKLNLTKCHDRKLASFEPLVSIWDYISNEENIFIEKDIKVIDLHASFQDVAKDIIKKLFMLFNWNDADNSMIEGWQKKLLERKGF